MKRKRVLFLCTGNSCRSQMAEALVNHHLGDRWEALSAGTNPAGYVHPLAIEVMAELGIDLSTQRSKSVGRFRDEKIDLVVTVCDDAAENCPVWLGSGRVVHDSFTDPALATGTHADRLAVFRQVRDAISHDIVAYLDKEIIEANERSSN
jgi:arsenate reductase